ncbi:MAG TPA: bifunctional adenosylcobinamide kinase/adenosylcobinamide-phosphate guanylyltransferase [Anaerolineae bacterium]|nr:bifunctional adenosylcobinamide kinase/adenosylcobinamide-phosphate guanylyltransferase [Anaerolineae bacterium]
MGELVLLLGGARSGKSAYAQRLARELGGDQVLFVATAEAKDEEMRARIEAHRRGRPATWRTIEAPRQTGRAIAAVVADARVVLVDCLTLLVSNILLSFGDEPDASEAEAAVLGEVEDIIDACAHGDATFVIVSNEVGLGLVPSEPLGRVFRDLLGRANQVLAAKASKVYWMIAGLPVELKSLQGRE